MCRDVHGSASLTEVYVKKFLLASATILIILASGIPVIASKSSQALPPENPNYLVISKSELISLPITGTSWETIQQSADASVTPDICNQDNNANVNALAAGIVYARTGNALYRTKAINLINRMITSQRDNCYNAVLAMGRQMGGWVLAADFADYHDQSFKDWLAMIANRDIGGHGRWHVLRFTAYDSASNWGIHALASITAIDLYLENSANIEKDWQVFSGYGVAHGWPFNKASSYNEQWSCIATDATGKLPIAINTPCLKSGINLDGAPVEDSSRSSFGSYSSYIHESMQGYAVMAQLWAISGRDGWGVNNSQICRAIKFADRAGRLNDSAVSYFVSYMANKFCGLNLPVKSPTNRGRMFGFSDWLYQNSAPQTPAPATTSPTKTATSTQVPSKTPTVFIPTRTSTPTPTQVPTLTPTLESKCDPKYFPRGICIYLLP